MTPACRPNPSFFPPPVLLSSLIADSLINSHRLRLLRCLPSLPPRLPSLRAGEVNQEGRGRRSGSREDSLKSTRLVVNVLEYISFGGADQLRSSCVIDFPGSNKACNLFRLASVYYHQGKRKRINQLVK